MISDHHHRGDTAKAIKSRKTPHCEELLEGRNRVHTVATLASRQRSWHPRSPPSPKPPPPSPAVRQSNQQTSDCIGTGVDFVDWFDKAGTDNQTPSGSGSDRSSAAIAVTAAGWAQAKSLRRKDCAARWPSLPAYVAGNRTGRRCSRARDQCTVISARSGDSEDYDARSTTTSCRLTTTPRTTSTTSNP
jgi:hypothetical protein